jgi:hypothetical protein
LVVYAFCALQQNVDSAAVVAYFANVYWYLLRLSAAAQQLKRAVRGFRKWRMLAQIDFCRRRA